jgi:hypothetical protein
MSGVITVWGNTGNGAITVATTQPSGGIIYPPGVVPGDNTGGGTGGGPGGIGTGDGGFETPSDPTITTPAVTNPAEGEDDIAAGEVATSSAFSASGGRTHLASRWMIAQVGDEPGAPTFQPSVWVYDSGATTGDLVTLTLPDVLEHETYYRIMVRHKASGGNWSNWSLMNEFYTIPCPEAFLLDLDASDAASITEVAGAVSEWEDQGGSINAEQATAALKPTYAATGTPAGAVTFEDDQNFSLTADAAMAASGYAAMVVDWTATHALGALLAHDTASVSRFGIYSGDVVVDIPGIDFVNRSPYPWIGPTDIPGPGGSISIVDGAIRSIAPLDDPSPAKEWTIGVSPVTLPSKVYMSADVNMNGWVGGGGGYAFKCQYGSIGTVSTGGPLTGHLVVNDTGTQYVFNNVGAYPWATGWHNIRVAYDTADLPASMEVYVDDVLQGAYAASGNTPGTLTVGLMVAPGDSTATMDIRNLLCVVEKSTPSVYSTTGTIVASGINKQIVSPGSSLATGKHLVEFILSATDGESKILVDGVELSVTETGTGDWDFAFNKINGASPFPGGGNSLLELKAYPTELTDAERLIIRNALADKWNITI